jgi:hypothetical protein
VKLHQERAERDEEGAEDQGSEDAVEEDAVLIAGRHAEVPEDEDEHEDVVDGKRVLDEVAGQELEGHPPGRFPGIEAGHREEARVLREVPQAVGEERRVEQERQGDPGRAPDDRLPEPHRPCLAVEDPEIQREQREDGADEADVQPPVLIEREEQGHGGHTPWSVAAGRRPAAAGYGTPDRGGRDGVAMTIASVGQAVAWSMSASATLPPDGRSRTTSRSAGRAGAIRAITSWTCCSASRLQVLRAPAYSRRASRISDVKAGPGTSITASRRSRAPFQLDTSRHARVGHPAGSWP